MSGQVIFGGTFGCTFETTAAAAEDEEEEEDPR